jgi:hypothetical protein
VGAVQALGPRLDPEQAQAALGLVLNVLKDTHPYSYYTACRALVGAVQALGPRLDPEQTQIALGPFLTALQTTTDADELKALADAVQALNPMPEQGQTALGPVLAALQTTPDPSRFAALAHTVQALGPTLEQARAALVSILAGLQTTPEDRSRGWLPPALSSLAHAVQALAARAGSEERGALLDLIRATLACMGSADTSRVLAVAVASLMGQTPDRDFATAIVDVLKYPTAAGEATDVLLDALHTRFSDAPGKEAGYEANLAWIQQTFPAIDVTSPPLRPPPPELQTRKWTYRV